MFSGFLGQHFPSFGCCLPLPIPSMPLPRAVSLLGLLTDLIFCVTRCLLFHLMGCWLIDGLQPLEQRQRPEYRTDQGREVNQAVVGNAKMSQEERPPADMHPSQPCSPKFIHSFKKCLSSTYYVPGTVLNAET